MFDLTPFKEAKTLTWQRHTVFRPHRGDDGNLVTDQDDTLALDTWLPNENRDEFQFDSDHSLGMVQVDPEELDDVHDAIRRWCWHYLGRDDINFEVE